MEAIAHTESYHEQGVFAYLHGLDSYRNQYNIDSVVLVLFLMQTVMYWHLTLCSNVRIQKHTMLGEIYVNLLLEIVYINCVISKITRIIIRVN